MILGILHVIRRHYRNSTGFGGTEIKGKTIELGILEGRHTIYRNFRRQNHMQIFEITCKTLKLGILVGFPPALGIHLGVPDMCFGVPIHLLHVIWGSHSCFACDFGVPICVLHVIRGSRSWFACDFRLGWGSRFTFACAWGSRLWWKSKQKSHAKVNSGTPSKPEPHHM